MNKQIPMWIETANGGYVDLSDIDNIRVEPSDITVGLASILRYKGLYPISVLRHSYAMYEYARIHGEVTDDNYLMRILLHDAAEAYIGDVPAPTKRLSNVSDLETKVHNHILKFLMVYTKQTIVAEWPDIEYLDRISMAAELFIYKHDCDINGFEETKQYYDLGLYSDQHLLLMVDIYKQIDSEFINDDFLAMHVENLIFRNMYKQGA